MELIELIEETPAIRRYRVGSRTIDSGLARAKADDVRWINDVIGQDHAKYMDRVAFVVAADVFGARFVGQTPVQLAMWSILYASVPSIASLIASITAWGESVQQRAFSLYMEIAAGTRANVQASDFADLGEPPHTFSEVMAAIAAYKASQQP